jgi:hypothetical protein
MEMQIIGLLLVTFIVNSNSHNSDDSKDKNYMIAYVLLVQHILSYFFSFYRKYSIDKKGKPDINGVMRGKLESFLGTFEILFASMITGYSLNYL